MNRLRRLIIIFLLIGISGCLGPPEKVPDFPAPIVWLNRPASFPLPSFKGKVTIIGFFTEGCEGCIKIQPVLKKILKQYGNKIQILGVYTPLPNQKPTIAVIKRFLREHDISYPIIHDRNSSTLRIFHVTGWPTLIFSDADANIVNYMHGFQTEQSIQHSVDRALRRETSPD